MRDKGIVNFQKIHEIDKVAKVEKKAYIRLI